MTKEDFQMYKVRFRCENREHYIETRERKTVELLRRIFDTGYVPDDATILQTLDLSDE